MPTNYLNIECPNCGTRNEIRKNLIDYFIQEEPGTGTGKLSTKYFYYVDTLANGDRVYLARPAYLNKGFDFVIHVENHSFRRGKTNPTHGDILDDLLLKKRNDPAKYSLLYEAIKAVHSCSEITSDMYVDFDLGFSTEMLLKVTKWFFIEQDVTYWNFSGRDKFMQAMDALA